MNASWSSGHYIIGIRNVPRKLVVLFRFIIIYNIHNIIASNYQDLFTIICLVSKLSSLGLAKQRISRLDGNTRIASAKWLVCKFKFSRWIEQKKKLYFSGIINIPIYGKFYKKVLSILFVPKF